MLNDLKPALRSLLATPAFTAVALIVLTLGIGATTAIFSLFHQVLVQSLPVPEPERLVELATTGPNLGGGSTSLSGNADRTFSYPMFRDLEQQQSVFAGFSAHRDFQASVAEGERTVAGAGMKSGKISTTLTNPTLVGPFSNTASKGSFSFKGTHLSPAAGASISASKRWISTV